MHGPLNVKPVIVVIIIIINTNPTIIMTSVIMEVLLFYFTNNVYFSTNTACQHVKNAEIRLKRLPAVLSSRRPGFDLRTISVGFSVDKVAHGQVYLLVLQFSPLSIIPPLLRTHVPVAYTI